ncbi:MAG: MFS transporter [Burkholderiaceae bacterium]
MPVADTVRRRRVFVSAFVVQFVIIGGMFAYGVFFKALENELGWSRTLLSAATSIAFFVMGVFAMVAGRANERFGPRVVLTVAGLCYALGYLLMVWMSAPWQLFLLYGGMVGIGLAAHDVTTLSTVARWFPQRRGLMTGFVKTGTALGQMILPLAAAALVTQFGWRSACLALGLGAGIALFLAAQGMSFPESDETSRAVRDESPGNGTGASVAHGAAGGARASTPAASAGGWPFAEARRTRQFWTLCALQFMFFPSLMTVPVHIVAHGVDLGLDVGRAAAVLALIGGISMVGRVLVGGFVDRIGGRRAYLICFGALVLSLFGLLSITSPVWLFAFALVYGFSHGGFFTVVSPTIAELFGLRSHSTIFGIVLFCGTLGGAIGPLLAGMVFDASRSYQPAFMILTGLAVLGLLLVPTLQPLPGQTR